MDRSWSYKRICVIPANSGFGLLIPCQLHNELGDAAATTEMAVAGNRKVSRFVGNKKADKNKCCNAQAPCGRGLLATSKYLK